MSQTNHVFAPRVRQPDAIYTERDGRCASPTTLAVRYVAAREQFESELFESSADWWQRQTKCFPSPCCTSRGIKFARSTLPPSLRRARPEFDGSPNARRERIFNKSAQRPFKCKMRRCL